MTFIKKTMILLLFFFLVMIPWKKAYCSDISNNNQQQDTETRYVVHKVKKGETLWSISRKYNSEINLIADCNGIRDVNFIIEGQQLKIPAVSSIPVMTEGKNISIASRGSTWPTRGIITSVFGIRDDVIHKGIDIAAPKGTNVCAFMSGTVTYSGWMNGYGNIVILNHGSGISTYYAHNSVLLVKNGAEVSKGQVIAKVGSTGDSTGPHSHFEIRVNGVPVDPLKYLK